MPIRRARHGKPLLAIGLGAATIGMVGCPIVSANLVAQPPQQCTPNDDINLWLSGSATLPVAPATSLVLTLAINSFQVTGVQLANDFVSSDAVINNVAFDGTSLAASTRATVTFTPNAGVTNVVIHSGANCAGAARAFDITVDTTTGIATLASTN